MTPRIFTRIAVITVGFAAAVALLSVDWSMRAADEKDKVKELPKRKSWTTSKVVGSPEPPPKYKSVRVFPSAQFKQPDLIARCPGSDRLFVGELEGTIYSLANK